MPFFSLKDKSKSKIAFKKKLKEVNQYFKSHGLKFGLITLIKAELNDVNDFDIKYVEDPIKNLNEITQQAKDECLMSEDAYSKFRQIIMPIATLPSISACNYVKRKLNNHWKINFNQYDHYIDEPIAKISDVCKNYLSNLFLMLKVKNFIKYFINIFKNLF